MKMKWILSLLVVLALVKSVEAAQSPGLQRLLDQLNSPDWRQRATVVRHIAAQPYRLRAKGVKPALVDLLERENKLVIDSYFTQVGVSEKFGEAYSEYYAMLLGAVVSVLDPSDQRALELVVRGSYNPDSALVQKLAVFGERLIPIVTNLAWTGIPPQRWNALSLMGEILHLNRQGRFAPPILPMLARDLTDQLRKAAADSNATVRRAAVRGIAAAGDKDSIALLQKIARDDPDVLQLSKGGVRYPVREQAIEAIQALNRQ